MAKIELSPQLGIDYVTRIMDHIDPNEYPGDPISQVGLMKNTPNRAGPYLGEICIMKGVMPVDFTNLVSKTIRNADILVQIKQGYYNGWDPLPSRFNSSIMNTNPCTIQSDYVQAAGTGIATWFWLRAVYYNDSVLDIPQQLIGTVGTTGSNADLEIPDVNILAGLPYRISNFKLEFPTSWSY